MFVHFRRAQKWRESGKVAKVNQKLFNKILSIIDDGFAHECVVVKSFENEKEALSFEEAEISRIGLENLCNLTSGGEGESKSQKTLEKISKSVQSFWSSEEGEALRKRFSEEKAGQGNPMWGVKESEDHKYARMQNFLATPRWNKGLKGDPQQKGHPKGEPTHNSIECKLVNEDGREFSARSLAELARLSGVPLISISRLRAGHQNRKKWRLEVKCLDRKIK